jgi:ADP-ribosylglycohydrolase
MLGALVGDIVGSIYEWNNHRSKDFPLFNPACIFTDDSVLTVALAEAILEGTDYAAVMRAYGKRYPSAGYGGMFRKWLRDPRLGPYGSYGNGAAMRISPAGWSGGTLDETLEQARVYTEITHNHAEGVKGAQAVAGAIWMGRHRSSKAEIRGWVERTAGYDLSRTCDQIRPGYRFNESCQQTVPEALVAFLESVDFEDAIRNAVSLGGDSDTLTCITGSVAEAFYGGVPAEIEKEALARLDDPLRETVKRFRERYMKR